MKITKGNTLRKRRALAAGIAGATVAAVVAAGGLATAANAAPTDDSEALGEILSSELLGAALLEAASTASGNPSDEGPNSDPLNLEALGALSVNLGGGLTIPLISEAGGPGLLDLGEVGTLNSFASSPTATSSFASAGAVTDDGTIAIDPDEDPGEYGPATVNLIALLEQLGLTGVTDEVVDGLSLEIGASASTASVENGVTDSEYVLAGAEFNLSSPLVADISDALDGLLTGVGTTLDTAVGDGGVIDSIVGAIDLDLGIPGVAAITVGGGSASINGLPAAIEAATTTLLATPLTDANELVSIDLGTGVVTIDLEQIDEVHRSRAVITRVLRVESDRAVFRHSAGARERAGGGRRRRERVKSSDLAEVEQAGSAGARDERKCESGTEIDAQSAECFEVQRVAVGPLVARVP
ncbi:MAG TPA: choice-of-anchor G family protein [Microbacterium sp.]|nr:choice-of-anchor G family protein [Microbacterium sp.]